MDLPENAPSQLISTYFALSFLQQRFNKGLKVRLIIFFFASTHNVHNNAIHKTINNSNVFASLLKIEVPYFYVHIQPTLHFS